MSICALGIDIAKQKFNVCLINCSGKLKHKVFTNTQAGFLQLRDSLCRTRRFLYCFR